jgi:hypothetical protein
MNGRLVDTGQRSVEIGIHIRRLGGQPIALNVADPLLSGYPATLLGRPAQGGGGTPRQLTGWLWPRS